MTRAVPALLATLVVTFAAGGFALAQGFAPAPQPASAEPGAELRIYLMTLSPGSIIYERFGHNALVVHDPNPPDKLLADRAAFEARIGGRLRAVPPLLPTDRAHHYGAFDFEQDGFVVRFVMGRMEYWTASEWADATALSYAADGRGVLLQELNLLPAQKLELKRFLEWNELPENRFYRYDYYRDNCSTRVRDAIDRVTNGELQRQLKATPTGTTDRSHTRRLTSGLDPLDLFWFTGFTYVLGHPVDVPLSGWEEAFLPGKLADHVRTATITDAATGATRPLVLAERELSTSTRPPMPEHAPSRFGGYLIAGLLIGGAFAGLAWLGTGRKKADALPPSPGTPGEGRGEGVRQSRGGPLANAHRATAQSPNPLPAYRERGPEGERRQRPPGSRLARAAFALLIIPWALVWGVGAVIGTNGWAVTDHAASYRNENLLQMTPLILPLAVLGPAVAFGRRRGARLAVWLAGAGAAASVLGLVLKVLPSFWQHNAEVIALALPANLGLAAAIALFARGTRPALRQDADDAPANSASKPSRG